MANSDSPGGELILTTHGRNYGVPYNKNATVVFMGSDNFETDALAQVRAYVETHGTLKSLTIVGHGLSEHISSEERLVLPDDASKILDIPRFLDGLKKIKSDLGEKVADRIVFDACDTMTSLSSTAVKSLRDNATQLGAQIVGAMTEEAYQANQQPGTEWAGNGGLRALFGPDGSVHLDKSSSSPEAFAVSQILTENHSFLGTTFRILTRSSASLGTELEAEKGAEWFACHDGKKQEEGAACQALLPKERSDSRDLSAVKQASQVDDKGASNAITTDPATVKQRVPVPSL